GEKITMTTNTTIHNNHHVIYKPWHTCRPYDNIMFIIIACIFIPIPIPTHDKDGNQKYIGTLLSSQTTQSHHHTPSSMMLGEELHIFLSTSVFSHYLLSLV
ncbi:hypothetical protein ACQX1D_09970, partial [Corynebacterium diphtheriae]